MVTVVSWKVSVTVAVFIDALFFMINAAAAIAAPTPPIVPITPPAIALMLVSLDCDAWTDCCCSCCSPVVESKLVVRPHEVVQLSSK